MDINIVHKFSLMIQEKWTRNFCHLVALGDIILSDNAHH